MNWLQIKFIVLSFVPAAPYACLQPLTKHLRIYANAATIFSPVWVFNF